MLLIFRTFVGKFFNVIMLNKRQGKIISDS